MSIYLIVLIAMCGISLLGIIISLLTCCELAFDISAVIFSASLGTLLATLFFVSVIDAALGGCS